MRRLLETMRRTYGSVEKELVEIDNETAHTSILFRWLLDKNNTIRLQPPCSPEMTPVTFSVPEAEENHERSMFLPTLKK